MRIEKVQKAKPGRLLLVEPGAAQIPNGFRLALGIPILFRIVAASNLIFVVLKSLIHSESGIQRK